MRLARTTRVASVGRPPIAVDEVKLASQWWTYRNTKAKRELGWQPSPHEETLEATIGWYAEREGDRILRARRSQPLGFKLAASALGAFGGATRTTRRLLPLTTA
jgi:hypothetical protein